MANEAYRAVFLRVHPTGKMVLSLTTDPMARSRSTRSSSPTSSACRRSTSRSSRPTPTASAWGTASTRARPTARRRRSQGHGQDPRQGAAARRHGARGAARDAHVVERRLGRAATAATRRRSRPSRTSRSTPTAPARCRPASRAASTRSRSTATDGDDRDATRARGRGAEGRRHGDPGGRRPAGLPRQRARRLRLRGVRQPARRGDGRRPT